MSNFQQVQMKKMYAESGFREYHGKYQILSKKINETTFVIKVEEKKSAKGTFLVFNVYRFFISKGNEEKFEKDIQSAPIKSYFNENTRIFGSLIIDVTSDIVKLRQDFVEITDLLIIQIKNYEKTNAYVVPDLEGEKD